MSEQHETASTAFNTQSLDSNATAASNLRMDCSSASSTMEFEAKRFKSEHFESEPPLEERLVGVLCCVVCLDLPNQTFFQCTNGHLMCISCLTHLLADARIKDENSTCPQCRCEINRNVCIRNLAVEKAISELPILCGHCSKQMPRSALDNHEKNLCPDRLVQCSYTKLGCTWEVLPSVQQALAEKNKEMSVFRSIYDLLSAEKIVPIDAQLRPGRTDEYIPKLFYESNRFTAHSYQWTVKARLSYVAVKGPFGEVPINPAIHDFEFSSENSDSAYKELILPSSTDCNRLLAGKTINIRLIIVQNVK
ncbi:hypothetical protein HELRODRAFT_165872 [Helobdella robusta]|uniref:RING-type domain-containing protein n=1 Tax=Helobdella robusta TaxID=6412 RepID=T1EXD8_HELRO|nr:hypothetical protein HELRODRAFT_165872 [Helobdella robusta]ESN91792.1 hypothetical protein HELRODRAFT_165872 [Helobdella robusta]